MESIHVSDTSEPRVENAQVSRRESGFDTPAVVMTTNNNVFDMQMTDSIVDD
jgi:hypothetical protein